MVWLTPLALVGLAAVAAPILIHILVQRRATPFPFPTLRFLQPTRLAAIRRHVLEDLPLLAVRVAAIAAAAGALAGPLLLTPARRAAWNARLARAIVSEGAARAFQGAEASYVERFDTVDLRDGIARAVAWLDTAPPARRELVVVSPFALDSIAHSDLSQVPRDVGIRLVRSGQLPAHRSLEATPVLHADPGSPVVHRRDRTIELNGPATSVRESAGSPAAAPVEIVATADEKRAAEAALAAVLSQRVFAPPPDRQARVVFAASSAVLPAASRSASLAPWIADAIARLTIDEALQAAGPASAGSDVAKPWFTASSDGARLVVTTTVPASARGQREGVLAPKENDIRTALLLRSIVNALAAGRTSPSDILPIPDAVLRTWERPAGDVRSPRLDTIAEDDRRWWWAAVLALLIAEMLIRRARNPQRTQSEFSRVA
ncbi:MAG TPA: BatA domain-containing protein [Vicinamibacterales bacterium]|nr:BatA domain-containing protein [Vicinamibacterales bacterium]